VSLIRVSHSSLRTFQTCPQKYVYTYHHKRVPNAFSPALQVGSFVHEALDRWWDGGPNKALEWMSLNSGELSDTELAKVAAMLEHYNPPRDEFELLENEASFEMSVINPATGKPLRGWRVIGYADGLLRRKSTGKLVVRECKTTASDILGFGPYWQRLTIDAQVGMYALAFDVDEIVYDVLRKPQLKISKADREEAEKRNCHPSDPYCERVSAHIAKEPEAWHQWRVIQITEADKELAQASLYKAVRALHLAEKEGIFPMHSGSCSGFGTCKYLGVCTGNDDLWDPVRFRDKLSRAEIEAQKAGGA
jgi:hypothetical protein